MLYKTILLELIQQQPQIYEQLRRSKKLLATLNLYSSQLKARHESWKQRLEETRPHSDARQIASEALEIALKEVEARLPGASLPSEEEPLSLEAAMAFLRTPPA